MDFKSGTYILCKKNFCLFKRSHLYLIDSISEFFDFWVVRVLYNGTNYFFYEIKNFGCTNINLKPRLKYYFYTPSETRKLKLLKIKNV